jgi:hypothetical protein
MLYNGIEKNSKRKEDNVCNYLVNKKEGVGMKRKFHVFTLLIIMLLAIIGITMDIAVQQVYASEKTETNYINVICKNLYLGKTGKNKFNFNIKRNEQMKGATYHWYIVKDKGTPNSITIDSNTGVVTAKRVGTAFIRCKITLADKTELFSEAKIIVINNITKVTISNISENRTISVESNTDFNESISDTSAGEKVTASGITRWEIANDTAEVGNATEDGIVNPKKTGEFQIRAICFQNIQNYEAWLTNKASKDNLITAKSDWITITVMPIKGEASTQEQLDALLATEHIKQITLSSNTEQKINIHEGDFSDRTLIVNAPNTDISNYGLFKNITINSAANTTWEENAVNNSIEIKDSYIRILITEKSQVKCITFDKAQATLTTSDRALRDMEDNSLYQSFLTESYHDPVNLAFLSVNGKLDKLDIISPSAIKLFGFGEVDQVVVEKTAVETKIATSVKTAIVADTDIMLTLFEGVQSIEINTSEDITVKIENLSPYSVGLYFNSLSYMSLTSYQEILITSKGDIKLLGKVFTSSVIKLTPSVILNVTATTIHKGQILRDSTLTGTFTFNSMKIEGILTWLEPETVVNASEYFLCIFTPADTVHYHTVSRLVKVEVI